MKNLIVLVLLFGLAFASDVIDLSDADFQDVIREHDVVLVEFFAPWCGHCKKLAPEYEKAATALSRNDPPIALAKTDCTEAGKASCSKYGVSGYPTLKIFKNGELSKDYDGPRDSNGIVSTMKKMGGPVAKEITSVADMDKYVDHYDGAVIGFFSKADGEDHKEFMKAAGTLSEHFRVAYTTDEAVLEKYEHTDAVVVFRPMRLKNKFEDSTVVFDGAIKGRKVHTWVRENALGLCGHLTPDNQDLFQKPLITVYYNVDYVRNIKGSNYWRNRVMKVGKKYTDQDVNFAVANFDDFIRDAEAFGFKDASADPPLVGARSAKGDKYAMTEKFSVDNFDAFVQKFVDGELEAYMKSEPIPEDDGKHVTTVVGRTFNDIVMDDTKDVLIEFYAPWCGHCKSLEPKYEELAEKLKDEPSIVIAKMDATANDTPGAFEVQGFPTLYWAPKDKKDSPRKYQGGREVDDFIKFIEKETSINIAGKKSEL